MKTYETWEMLKELTENPHKEFEKVSNGVSSGLYARVNEHGRLFWGEDYNFLNLSDTWEAVKKPVDFITAVDSGKAVSVEYSGYKYEKMNLAELLRKLGFEHNSLVVRLFILYGTWYIEE